MPVEQRWPEDDLFVMHHVPFMHDIVHIENIGGDIEQVLNTRCLIGGFPWRFEGDETKPYQLGEGDLILIDPWVPHAVTAGPRGARILSVVSPSRAVGDSMEMESS